jgi:hypothetical protein
MRQTHDRWYKTTTKEGRDHVGSMSLNIRNLLFDQIESFDLSITLKQATCRYTNNSIGSYLYVVPRDPLLSQEVHPLGFILSRAAEALEEETR